MIPLIQIEQYYLNTNQRSSVAVTVNNPTGITLHGNKLYYMDLGYESISELSLPDTIPRVLRTNLFGIEAIKSFTNRHNQGN